MLLSKVHLLQIPDRDAQSVSIAEGEGNSLLPVAQVRMRSMFNAFDRSFNLKTTLASPGASLWLPRQSSKRQSSPWGQSHKKFRQENTNIYSICPWSYRPSRSLKRRCACKMSNCNRSRLQWDSSGLSFSSFPLRSSYIQPSISTYSSSGNNKLYVLNNVPCHQAQWQKTYSTRQHC